MESKNKNIFSLSKYSLVFKYLPDMTFFIQSLTFPGLNVGFVDHITRFSNVPIPGDSIQYDDLVCNIILDEDWKTIQKLNEWMVNNNKRDDDKQYNNEEATSTATLLLSTNNNTNNLKIEFEGIFPLDLGGFELAYNESNDGTPTVFSAIFKFQRWNIVDNLNG